MFATQFISPLTLLKRGTRSLSPQVQQFNAGFRMSSYQDRAQKPAQGPSDRSTRRVDVEPGVSLSIIEQGAGRPIVIVPGWSQTALEWSDHIDHLARSHRVLAIDMRGHGESSKPAHGYHVSRFAADLDAVLNLEDLEDVTLMGHSMGCSVIWSYLELFGAERVARLVLVDQTPSLLVDPLWSDERRQAVGGVFTFEVAMNLLVGLRGREADALTLQFVQSMTSGNFPETQFRKLLEQNLTLPRDLAAKLLYDHIFNDWTDTIRRITLPTLVIGAKGSIMPWRGVEAIGKMISGSKTFIFDAEPSGSHFAFLEDPTTFLALLDDFLKPAGLPAPPW